MAQISELSTFLVPGRKHSFTAKEAADVSIPACGVLMSGLKLGGVVAVTAGITSILITSPKLGGLAETYKCGD